MCGIDVWATAAWTIGRLRACECEMGQEHPSSVQDMYTETATQHVVFGRIGSDVYDFDSLILVSDNVLPVSFARFNAWYTYHR